MNKNYILFFVLTLNLHAAEPRLQQAPASPADQPQFFTCEICTLDGKTENETILLHPKTNTDDEHRICKNCLRCLQSRTCPFDRIEIEENIFKKEGLAVPPLESEFRGNLAIPEANDDNQNEYEGGDYESDDNQISDDEYEYRQRMEDIIGALKKNPDFTLPDETSELEKLLKMPYVYETLEELTADLQKMTIDDELVFEEEDIWKMLNEKNMIQHLNLTSAELYDFYKNFVRDDFDKTLSDDEDIPQDLSGRNFFNPEESLSLNRKINAQINTYPESVNPFIRIFCSLPTDKRKELLDFQRIHAIQNALQNNSAFSLPEETSQLETLLGMRIVYDGLEQLAFNLERDALQQDLDSENIMDELEEINEKRHFNLTDVQLDHFYKNFVNEDFEKSFEKYGNAPQDLSGRSFFTPEERSELNQKINAEINTYPESIRELIRSFTTLSKNMREELLNFERTLRQERMETIKNALSTNPAFTLPEKNSTLGKLLKMSSVYDELKKLAADLQNFINQQELSFVLNTEDILEKLDELNIKLALDWSTEERNHFHENFVGPDYDFESSYEDENIPQDLSGRSFFTPEERSELNQKINAEINTYPESIRELIHSFTMLPALMREELLNFEHALQEEEIRNASAHVTSLKRERNSNSPDLHPNRRFHENEKDDEEDDDNYYYGN